jgi:hypothetical protein
MADTADECDNGKETFDAETASTGIYGNNLYLVSVHVVIIVFYYHQLMHNCA